MGLLKLFEFSKNLGRSVKSRGNKIKEIYSFTLISKRENGEYKLPNGYSSVSEVGEIIDVTHMTFHNLKHHAINVKMDFLRNSKGYNVNAFYIEKFERIEDHSGRTYFQPLRLNK